jgi:uncharacterized protein YndB with AHSA1/START domain
MSKIALTTYRQKYRLPTAPQRVFAALTQRESLIQWFTGHVEIEPRVGGAFRFWGRHVPWMLEESNADQVITRFDPPHLLAFTWTWRGCRTEVELELRESGIDGTELILHHAAAGPLWRDHDEAKWVLGDFWRMTVGNLRSYLTTGERALHCDFSQTSGDVTLSIDIDAPPEDVFRALSQPALMDKWLSKEAKVELRAGGNYSYGWTTGKGAQETPAGPAKLIEVEPNRLLVHDWKYGDEPPTRVRWELQPIGKRTRVTLTHTRFDDPDVHGGYSQGWAAFLVALKDVSEGREADRG